ncbi:MAG: AGE family epimerase/isomerase [Phycisphaeraceae bacterium]
MTISDGNIPAPQLRAVRDRYHGLLFADVVPWWLRHARDEEQGGYFNCLNRDGTPYTSEKYFWPTARQVWFFSHLYRHHEARPEWLAHARHGFDFLDRYGFASDGKMYFRTGRAGEPRATCLSLYTECFAAMAYAAFGAATGQAGHVRRAVQMFQRILPRLGKPTDTPLLGYPILAEFHLHAHDMIRLTVAEVLFDVTGERLWRDESVRSVESILTRHWHPQLDALLEQVSPVGKPMLDLPEARLVHPGHALESAWMILEVALAEHREDWVAAAVAIIRSSYRRGWDNELGGLRYLMNLDGSPAHALEADCKLLWPQCEALYATFLGWKATGAADLRGFYEQIEQYLLAHFRDPEHGEFFGYLNRDGSPIFTAKANGWEGCFHLPRVLFRMYQAARGLNQ